MYAHETNIALPPTDLSWKGRWTMNWETKPVAHGKNVKLSWLALAKDYGWKAVSESYWNCEENISAKEG